MAAVFHIFFESGVRRRMLNIFIWIFNTFEGDFKFQQRLLMCLQTSSIWRWSGGKIFSKSCKISIIQSIPNPTSCNLQLARKRDCSVSDAAFSRGNQGKPRNPHETGGSGSRSQPVYNPFTTFAKTGRALICQTNL